MNFKQHLITLCIQARIDHKEAIEAFPVNEVRKSKMKIVIPEYRYMPENNDDIGKMFDITKPIADKLLTELFSAFADNITLDLNGHCRQDEALTLKQYTDKNQYSRFSIDRIVYQLSHRLTGVIFNIPITATIDAPYDGVTWNDIFSSCFDLIDYDTNHLLILGREHFACCDCGDSLRVQLDMETGHISLFNTLDFRDRTVKDPKSVPPTTCAYPNGIGTYSIDIHVPSGKLVLANALTRLLDKKTNHGASADYINSKSSSGYGTISESQLSNVHHSQYYETLNMMYMQGTNGGPYVFQDNITGTVSIKDEYLYDLDSDTDLPNFTENEVSLGYISMSLWATTGTCYDTFVKMCEKANKDVNEMLEELEAIVVNVEPGKYRANNHYFDSDASDALYVTITKLG